MDEICRTALDTSKPIFQMHGVNAAEGLILRRKHRRQDRLGFFKRLTPTHVARRRMVSRKLKARRARPGRRTHPLARPWAGSRCQDAPLPLRAVLAVAAAAIDLQDAVPWFTTESGDISFPTGSAPTPRRCCHEENVGAGEGIASRLLVVRSLWGQN